MLSSFSLRWRKWFLSWLTFYTFSRAVISLWNNEIFDFIHTYRPLHTLSVFDRMLSNCIEYLVFSFVLNIICVFSGGMSCLVYSQPFLNFSSKTFSFCFQGNSHTWKALLRFFKMLCRRYVYIFKSLQYAKYTEQLKSLPGAPKY